MKYKSAINEKYSLQQYEGKIRDLVISDIEQLNKIAIPICLSVYKYGAFCVQRPLNFGNNNITLNYIVYERDYSSDAEVLSTARRVLDHYVQVGPSSVNGYTQHGNIVLYIPVSLDTAPFTVKSLNAKADEDVYENVCDTYVTYRSSIIKSNSNSTIDVSSYKANNQNAIKLFLSELQVTSSVRQSLSIRTSSIIQILNHELTHIIDDEIDVSRINRFPADAADKVSFMSIENQQDMNDATDILYSLWSYTEFNAFTQTYGNPDIVKRNTKDNTLSSRVSSKIIGRNLGIDDHQSLDDYINTTQDKLGKVASNSDDSFWISLRDIVSDGIRDASKKSRISKMTPSKFKKYFIETTLTLINKFKEKTIKNVASQNEHDNDIKRMAIEIKKSCSTYIENGCDSENGISLRMKFNFYFKEYDQSYPVMMDFTTSPIKRLYKNNDDIISSRTLVKLRIPQLQILMTTSVKDMFGGSSNSYSLLYKELMSKQRISYLERMYFNLSDDIESYLNETV